MQEYRRGILGLLLGTGALIVLTVFSGGLGVLLHCLGDEAGGRMAGGMAAVLTAGVLLLQILQVTLLALVCLKANMNGDRMA